MRRLPRFVGVAANGEGLGDDENYPCNDTRSTAYCRAYEDTVALALV
jgi:hypothetical protein